MTLIRFVAYSILFFSMTILFSCRGAEQTASSEDQESPTQAPASDPSAPQAGDDTMGFRVWADSTPFSTYISHKGTGLVGDDFTSKCEINSTDSVKDISCLIEAEEFDLYYEGATVNYNVPSTMCSYVRIYMPYYFNFLPGIGPATATNNTNGSVINGGVAAGSTDESCSFNYTDAGGPNCCTGKYTLTTWSRQTSGADIPAVETDKSWGGKSTNCLSGPAMSLLQIGKSGLPRPDVSYVEDKGVKAKFIIPSPLKKLNFATNIFAANYFNAADHVGGVPLPYQAVPAYPTINPVKNYVFECLDRDEEIKARIQMQVREWNLESEFLMGAAGDPDSTGAESGFDNPANNDRYDLKDIPLNPADFPSGYPEEVPL